MLNYRKYVKIFIFTLAILLIVSSSAYASSVVTESNTTRNTISSSQVSRNTVTNSSSNQTSSSNTASNRNEETLDTSAQSYTVGATNSTTLQSVKQVDNSSSSIADINLVLNAILIAIGIVLILLSAAILIRLKK